MKKLHLTESTGRLLGLVIGIVYCILLFCYGVTQEVPIGTLEGKVTLAETGRGFGGATVTLSVPNDDSVPDHEVEADDQGNFRFRNVRAGDYQISVSASEHSMETVWVTVHEGHITRHDVRLKPNPPYLKLYASQRVWMPGDEPQVEVHGFRAGEVLDVEIDRVAFASLLSAGHFKQAVKELGQTEGFPVPSNLDRYATKVVEFRHKIHTKDSEGAFVEPINLSNLPVGFYWVKCHGGEAGAASYINVSDIALVTKTAGGHALAYVTGLNSGKPVPGAHIWSQGPGGRMATAVTGADGLAETVYASDVENETARASIFALRGNSTAVVGMYTGQDSDDAGGATFVLYTDRPIYRPGDDVQFKGFVRRREGLRYLPPVSGSAEIQINDTDDQPILKFPVKVSAHGSFSGHFSTSKEAGPGLYRIVATGFGSRGSHFVEMVAYRKPEMTVQVKSVRPYYFFGDQASVAIQCSYYFGGPVAGAKLQVNVFASPAPEEDTDDEEGGGFQYGGGELNTSVEAVTDEKGQAIVTFPTRKPDDKTIPLTDLNFAVNVDATDASNKYVHGVGYVTVVRGSYSLTAAAQNYLVDPGGTVDVLIRTRSHDPGAPPVPGRTVSVQASMETWRNGELKLKPIGAYSVVTGADGIAHALVKASAKGSMRIKAFSRDDAGRLITSEDTVYVLGGRWEAQADQSRMEVVLDKRHYKLGETARVMLRTVAPGGSALLTVQTDRVLWKKVVALHHTVAFIDLPITPEFLPNCFVTAAYVHHKKFYEGSAHLAVDPGPHRLQVSVTSDKPVYEPGSVAHLTVHTTASDGRPTAADVSVGVVDESIYALREDDFDPLEAFYPKRSNSVTTSYSFAEVYYDGGDKAPTNITIRKRFKDTAAWIPDVETGANGTANVTVMLPDNLTEWRTTAVGVSDSTATGKGTDKFVARKVLMARLEMPEFLVQQDDRQMTVIVTNDTGSDRDVHLQVQVQGVQLTGDLNQTVRVPADRPAAVSFGIKTGDPGSATVKAKAWIVDGPSDGVQQSFPVFAHGIPIHNAWSDDIPASKDYTVDLNTTTDRSTGRVKVDCSSGLAASLVDALPDLIGFPYGCVEQTMSRFMPSILVAKTVKDLGLPALKEEAEIPKIASDSMIRLARMQHEDGGWGWWQYDKSDAFMTALVLDGMARCKAAGYPIHKVDLPKALAWCLKFSHSRDWGSDDLRSQCYVIYVLARYGETSAAEAAYKTIVTRRTTPADRATLILALSEMGPAYTVERDRMLDRLTQLAHRGPMGAYWDGSDWDWGEESTALALTAFMAARPDDPIVREIVRHMMSHRNGAIWVSTRDTAYALVGLTQYLEHTHELAGDFDVRVSANGKLVRRFHVDARNPDARAGSVELPLAGLHSGPNTVRIEKSGKGVCYALVDLQASEIIPGAMPATPIPGLWIERKYYRLEARRLEDGSMMLMPTKHPVTSASSGDSIRVELTIHNSRTRRYIMIEDPTPSNCRVTDREDPDEGEQWSFWYDRFVIRDEKVAFFVRDLPEGTQTMTYTMQAEGLGVSHALPTTISNMYDPKEHAAGAESLLEVK